MWQRCIICMDEWIVDRVWRFLRLMLKIVIDKLWVVLNYLGDSLWWSRLSYSATDSLLSLFLFPHVQQAGRTDGYNQNISQIMPLSIGQLANFMVMLKKTKVRRT